VRKLYLLLPSFFAGITTTPEEVYYTPLSSFEPQQLTHIQDVPSLEWLKSEVIQWKSFDGLEIEGILTYPSGYKKGTKVPLVLWIHGGPASVSHEGIYNSRLASEGYAVFEPNYPGSLGYGKDFLRSNYKDFGGGDFKDILSGVNFLIEEGIVSSERIVIAGWSYGGFMSAWAVAHDQRFKAAIVGAGPTNWYSFRKNPVWLMNNMGYSFKDWYKASPVRYVKNIKTPVLVQHGDKGKTVLPGNLIELSYALKRLDVPHKSILYRGQGHDFTSPLSSLQMMSDRSEWMKSHIAPYKP